MPSITEVLQKEIRDSIKPRAYEVRYGTQQLQSRLTRAGVDFYWPYGATQTLDKIGFSNPYSQSMIENLISNDYEPVSKADIVSLGQTCEPLNDKRVMGDAYWTVAAIEASRYAIENGLLCASVGGDEFIFFKKNDGNNIQPLTPNASGQTHSWSKFLGTDIYPVMVELRDGSSIRGELKFDILTPDEVNSLKEKVDLDTQKALLYRVMGGKSKEYTPAETSIMFNSHFDTKIINGLLKEFGTEPNALDYISRVTRSSKDFYTIRNLESKYLTKIDNPGNVKFLNSIDPSGKLADKFILARLTKYMRAAMHLDPRDFKVLSNGPDLTIAVSNDKVSMYDEAVESQIFNLEDLGVWFPHIELEARYDWHKALKTNSNGKLGLDINKCIESLNSGLDSEFHKIRRNSLDDIATLISLAIALAPKYKDKVNRRNMDKAERIGITLNDGIMYAAQNIVDYIINLHENPHQQNEYTFDLRYNEALNIMLGNLLYELQ